MFQAAPGSRTLRQATGTLGAVALMALGAAPAVADDSAPGLVLGEIAPVTGLQPGGDFDVPVAFTNTGTEALGKVWLSYSLTQGLSHTELPSNCLRYEVGSFDEAPSSSDAVCEFDQTVAAGVVYAPEKSPEFTALDKAYADELRVTVASYDPAPTDGAAEPVRGTGPALRLIERPDATPSGTGSAEHADWDAAEVPVGAVNTADFQVAGAELKGEVGETVPFEVKFTNAGPAWVRRESGTPATEVIVKVPAGTTVTKAHGYCDKVEARTYECGTSQAWVDAGDGEIYDFRLRIDKEVTGAKGSVKLAGAARPFDENTANDTADILLDVAGSGGSSGGGGSTGGSGSTNGGGSTSSGGSTSGGATTTGGGSTSSSGGSATTGTSGSDTVDGDLASTGSSSALPLAGAAVAAVAVGTGAVLVVRRRKARR